MALLRLVVFVLAVSSVLADNVKMSGESICFSGKIAEEMMKHYFNIKYGRQSQNYNTEYRAKDCGDIDKKQGSGVYKIYPDGAGSGFDVYCNMDIDDGGWTVFQRRFNGETNFYRNWKEYESGFGNLGKEFWLGNKKLHILTSQGKYELRIDLEDFENSKRYAKYTTFSIGDATTKYQITVNGYSGNAGDALLHTSGCAFTTKDNDNDNWGNNCATEFKGAWWYNACHGANLNGLYLRGEHKSYADGVDWYQFRGHFYSLKATSMMIRKLNYLS